MAKSEAVQQAFNILEGMKNLRGYPYGKDAVHRLVQALLKASDNDVEKLSVALDHFQSIENPCVPTANQVRNFIHIEMRQMDAKDRLAALRDEGVCEKCENEGRYIREGWKKDPLRPGKPADLEHGRPAVPPGKRWTSWVEFCHCGIGKIRANLHKLWREHLKKSA